jgi:hypothetical protein
MTFRRLLFLLVFIPTLALLLGGSGFPPGGTSERLRIFTRDIQYDYISWSLNALGGKLSQLALGAANYLPESARHQVALEYLKLVQQIQQDEARLADIYADPQVTDPQAVSAPLRAELRQLYARRDRLGPLAESILQDQISEILAEAGLSLGGQPIPPVLYHTTPLPMALIISPRNVIRQDEDISLVPDLPLEDQIALEDKVDKSLDVSSLVVGIGGIGLYPTMVMQTTDLNWLAEVVSHEWIHNYLTLRPLGASYMNSPELRTMNETTASIAGKEIGRMLIERYYPELLPPPQPEIPPEPSPVNPPSQPPAFNFNKEMHETRVTVDQFLALGKVEDAEKYMELRRILFWENGYHIRKLNQAYFAFYGAYADQPGGAAGEDPVGAAVRALRAQSPTLADFVKRISWMSSYDQLRRTVSELPGNIDPGS